MSASRTTRVALLSMVLAAIVLALGPSEARADLVVTVLSSSAPVGGTGSFDVNLSNNGATSVDVSGFSVELSVPGGSGVSFTAVDVNTTATYLFGTLQTPPLTFDTFPTTDLTASDFSGTPPYVTTLQPNDTFGLEHVSYSVAPGTALGPVTVSILGLGTTTEILDIIGNPITPTDPTDGTITIMSAVPEPSTLWMLTSALIGVTFALGSRRHRTSTQKP